MLARIRADLARAAASRARASSASATTSTAAPTAAAVDRGADRARGLRPADRLPARQPRQLCRRPICATRTGTTVTYHWLHPTMGGGATLASYGVPGASAGAARRPPRRLRRRLSRRHTWLSRACELWHRGSAAMSSSMPASGPACRSTEQTARRPDLDPRAVPELERRTSASRWCTATPSCRRSSTMRTASPSTPARYRTGMLSCLVLEGDEVALLDRRRPAPLAGRARACRAGAASGCGADGRRKHLAAAALPA